MNLLRYYFMVGGGGFDVNKFSLAAIESGFVGGISRITSNTKKLNRGFAGKITEIKILSGITGTNGDGYASWQTALVDYAVDRDVYLAKLNLNCMTTEWAQGWLREEEAVLKFLGLVTEKLPPVAEFCKGECFSLLKLIYGYSEADGPGCGGHYSEAFMKCLGDLNAGLSIDSEPFELHFKRLQSAIRSS